MPLSWTAEDDCSGSIGDRISVGAGEGREGGGVGDVRAPGQPGIAQFVRMWTRRVLLDVIGWEANQGSKERAAAGRGGAGWNLVQVVV